MKCDPPGPQIDLIWVRAPALNCSHEVTHHLGFVSANACITRGCTTNAFALSRESIGASVCTLSFCVIALRLVGRRRTVVGVFSGA